MSHRYSEDPDVVGRDLLGLRDLLRALARAEDEFMPLSVAVARYVHGEHLCDLALRCRYIEESGGKYRVAQRGKKYLSFFGWEE